MNLRVALKILANKKKHTDAKIAEAKSTAEIYNSLRICPKCKQRIVYYEQYKLGGCFPCLQTKYKYEGMSKLAENKPPPPKESGLKGFLGKIFG